MDSDRRDSCDELCYFYSLYKVEVYETLFTGTLNGAYILVYLTSVYVLMSKPGFTSSRLRIFLFGITTLMFAMGIIALVLETRFTFLSGLSAELSMGMPVDVKDIACYYAWATVTYLMCILCDAICAWRTVVIWNKDKRVIYILVCFLLMTTVTAIIALSRELILAYSDIGKGSLTLAFGELGPLVVGPTLGTNLLSTGLIAWKAWKRRIEVKEHLREGKGFVRVDRVFILLVESGVIYSCIWIVYLILTSTKLPNPDFTSMALVSGLYPTLIIIFISKQMSPVEHYSTDSDSTEMWYAAVPTPRSPTDGSVDLEQNEHMVEWVGTPA